MQRACSLGPEQDLNFSALYFRTLAMGRLLSILVSGGYRVSSLGEAVRTGQAFHRLKACSLACRLTFLRDAAAHSFAGFPRIDLQIQLSVQKPFCSLEQEQCLSAMGSWC